MPITVAPAALNRSVASANSCASAVQPGVNAAGKKYSTTGPLRSWSDRVSVKTFPPMAPRVVKSGAAAPTASALVAAFGTTNRAVAAVRPTPAIADLIHRFMSVSLNVRGAYIMAADKSTRLALLPPRQ